jgi:hypothetical protein
MYVPDLQDSCEILEKLVEKDCKEQKLTMKEFVAINEVLLICQMKGMYKPK